MSISLPLSKILLTFWMAPSSGPMVTSPPGTNTRSEPADPDSAAARLRQSDPPIVCRIHKDALLFDPRTVLPEQEETLLTVIAQLLDNRPVS